MSLNRRFAVLVLAASSLGCASITLKVSFGPEPEPDDTWYRTMVQTGSPEIWPITLNWHPLGGTWPQTRHTDDEVPFVAGSAMTSCVRRSGLFVTTDCSLGFGHGATTGLGRSPPLVLAPSPLFSRPTLVREGSRLTVKGPRALVTKVPFELLDGIDFVHLDIDNRTVDSAWFPRKVGPSVTCSAGEPVELPLYSRPAPWELWHVSARGVSGHGIVARAQWPQWRDAASNQTLLASSSTSKTASFICPALAGDDALALMTDNGHPDLVYVALLKVTRPQATK